MTDNSIQTKNRTSGALPHINVTPLIDVLLVLLIIFMVITPLKSARFEASVPREPEERKEPVLPDPLTLVVQVDRDFALHLNQNMEVGTVDDPSPLVAELTKAFAEREETGAFRKGMELRADLQLAERVERTVHIKAPRSIEYGEVVKVIDAVKGAGAKPVGLQIDDLAQ